MLTNTVLRFGWVIYIAPDTNLRLKGFLTSLVEVIRRWQWNVRSLHVYTLYTSSRLNDIAVPPCRVRTRRKVRSILPRACTIMTDAHTLPSLDSFRVTREYVILHLALDLCSSYSFLSVPLPYTIPHEPASGAASIVNDQDDEDEAVQGEQYVTNPPPPQEVGTRTTGRLAKLVPNAVGQKVKTAIWGKKAHLDESDDEDEDSPHSATEKGGNGQDDSSRGRQSSQLTGTTRDGGATPRVETAERKNYNTFGWDSDVEGVKAPDQAHRR